MSYKYYILSAADDFYMSDALLRELEKTGAPCYFNLRDSKKKNYVPDGYSHIASDCKILTIVNDGLIKDTYLKSSVSGFKMAYDVYLLQNAPISEMPSKWKKLTLFDATKGLNADILSMIKGEKSIQSDDPILSTSTKSDRTEIKPEGAPESTQAASSASAHEAVFYRPDNTETIYEVTQDDDVSQTLQRALRYIKGEGVPQDLDRAYTLIKKAISENPDDAIAQYYWGTVNESGFGDGTVEDARNAYEKSIALGFSPAIISLGMLSYQEKPTDNKEAFDLFSKARENKDMMGAYGLGLLSEADEKYDEAIEYYSEAAESGNPSAQNALGCLYGEGKGVKQDYNKAIQWFQLAAETELPEAMINCGLLLYNSPDSTNKEIGEKLLRKAADQGNEIAEQMLRKIEQDKKKAKRSQSGGDRNDDDNRNDSNGGESAWGAFLDGLDLPGLAGFAKSALWG